MLGFVHIIGLALGDPIAGIDGPACNPNNELRLLPPFLPLVHRLQRYWQGIRSCSEMGHLAEREREREREKERERRSLERFPYSHKVFEFDFFLASCCSSLLRTLTLSHTLSHVHIHEKQLDS